MNALSNLSLAELRSGVRRFAVFWTFASMAAVLSSPSHAREWSISSPRGKLVMNVRENGGTLLWRVEVVAGQSRITVLKDSPLGLELKGHDLFHGLTFETEKQPRKIDIHYTLPHGKRREYHAQANQSTLTFKAQSGLRWEVDLRASDDGVAFRYRILSSGETEQSLVMENERTGFGLPEGARFWAAPSDKPSTYAPAYETYYGQEMDLQTVAPLGLGWSFPLLYRTADGKFWGLITEADVSPPFCGSRLSSAATNGIFSVTLPNAAEGNSQGDVHPKSKLPWEMPWRVVIIGDSLGTIVQSTLVTDVSSPTIQGNFDWVKPGRVAWSWWSDNPSPKSAAAQKKFIDLAAEMGWEYVLVDANWTIMENGNIHDVLNYAKSKGIGILLWYNSGGPHNVVTEKPRDCFTYGPVRQFELKLLGEWGVKGVKVDFFQSDKQEAIELYQAILADAADAKIMMNFHGCTLPRGWERKYPQLMSMEAVRGEECYIFDPKYPEAAPVQNTILPFSRNAVGPMDYTPAGLSNNRYPHLTSVAHELALTVIFESGWLHFADKPESYLNLPAEPRQFLKEVPVAWDESRFLAGYPGQFVALARRHDRTWYIAAINGENKSREVRIEPRSWLESGTYKLTTIMDGANPQDLKSQIANYSSADELKINLQPRGGFIGILKK